jgi:hypothetical protein
MSAYLTRVAADTLAATTLGLVSWSTATNTEKDNALDLATRQIDRLPWQGRKYSTSQVNAFPRTAYDDTGDSNPYSAPINRAATVVWDWDSATNAAVVPPDVKTACLYQADSLLQWIKGRTQRERTLDDQHDGVTYNRAGDVGQSYRSVRTPDRPGPDGVRTGICRRSWELLERYRLKAGRLL